MKARFAVIGHPIAHSMSPQIHEQFARQLGVALTYERLLAPLEDFDGTVAAFFEAGGTGANITVPFKSQAAGWVDRLDRGAAQAQAVNTIVRDGSRFRGCNTDGAGLIADLRNIGLDLHGARVLVLGAGGAAAGVLGPLRDAGVSVLCLANRTSSRAAALARRFTDVRVVPLAAPGAGFDLIVNATATGLDGRPRGFDALLPASARSAFEGAFCYDMVYGDNAQFGRYAAAHGAAGTADGLGMLVEQAAVAFELWHGLRPQTAPVIAALDAHDRQAGE